MATTDQHNSEDIAQQQELLATYRRTLAHLLQQSGSAHAIAEVRAQIQQIKASLRANV